MCKMRVVVNREMLGTRETGWSLWDGKQMMELTAKQIKDTMRKGNKVCGLTLDDKGELIPDKEGFFTINIMEHRHCGQYRPMVEAEGYCKFYLTLTVINEIVRIRPLVTLSSMATVTATVHDARNDVKRSKGVLPRAEDRDADDLVLLYRLGYIDLVRLPSDDLIDRAVNLNSNCRAVIFR